MDALHRRVVRRIRDLSRAKKITVSHLPDLAGVSQSHFWEVMAGHTSPTLKWIGKIAATLEIDAHELFVVDSGPRNRAAKGSR